MRTVKYKQIIDYIKDHIATGEWPIGSKLPSQRELAKIFTVNRSTVITALEELIADGLIEGKMGKGTIVINNTWTLMKQEIPTNWNENIPLGTILQACQPFRQSILKSRTKSLFSLVKESFPAICFLFGKCKQ